MPPFYLMRKKSPARTSKLIFNQFAGNSSHIWLFIRQIAAYNFSSQGSDVITSPSGVCNVTCSFLNHSANENPPFGVSI